MRTLIANGRVITACEDINADVLIEDGRISAIGRDLRVGDDVEIHDASGCLLMPGGVDVHTHLDSDIGTAKSVDTFATGGRAAAFGGTTSIVDFCNQTKGTSLLQCLDDWHRRAACATVDVGAHMVMMEFDGQARAEMKTLMTRDGITSFKLFTAYPGVLMVDDGTMIKVMQAAGEHGGQVSVHCENGHIIQNLVEEAIAAGHTAPKYHALTRPPLAEGEATNRVIAIAETVGTPVYIVHVSAKQALRAITEGKERGVPVHGETCTQYLFLTADEYDKPGFEGAKAVCSPPLRSRDHVEALWGGLETGGLDVVATDHCPFTYEDVHGIKFSKQLGTEGFHKIPGGAPGIEERLTVLFGGMRDRGFSLNKFVDVTATAPAKLFGLYPRKGTIEVGSDADIVIINPDKQWTIEAADGHGRCDYSLFEGHQATCKISKVFLRGRLIVDGNQWLGKDGYGEYLPRSASGQM
jgi:dihydropyrimidinase